MKVRLEGLVVKAETEDYVSKAGIPTKAHKVYLASGDPVQGATQVSVHEDDFAKCSVGTKIRFVPAFSIRNVFGTQTVVVRVYEGLEVVK